MSEPGAFGGVIAEVGVSTTRWLQSADILVTEIGTLCSAPCVLHDLLRQYPGSQVVVGRHSLGRWCVIAVRDHGVVLVLPIAFVIEPAEATAIGQILRLIGISELRRQS
jgi:hypothetical protein